MDIKKIAFKWFDKVILLIALAFAAYAFTQLKPSVKAKDLEGQARDLIQKVERNLKRKPGDLKLEKLRYARDFAEAYKPLGDVPPRAKTAWYPPRDMVDTLSVMRTQEALWQCDKPIREDTIRTEPYAKETLGKISISLTPDKKGLKVKGEQEGKAQVTFFDIMGQRYVLVVTVTPFIPKPKVFPPRKPEIEMAKGSKTVKLTWEPPDARDDRAPIQGYNVYRRKKNQKKFKRLHMVPVQARGKTIPGGTYEDSNTAFDETYVYAVSSYSPNAVPPESKKSAEADIYIPSDIEFAIKSATPPRDGGKATANVKIHKWVKDYGGWMSKSYFQIKIGEEIGTLYEGYVFLAGKRQKIKVDYRTGCFLVDVYPRVNIRVFRFGRFSDYPATYIVYVDKRGNLKEKWSYEEDAAPWGRFGSAPPERTTRHPRAKKRIKRGRKPGGLEQDLEALGSEEERRRAEDEARKAEDEMRRKEKERGAERPEEIQ
ncbi:MAG: fibronectin type III domain-containing protein [Planctomycetes bacterium]|nr:fibronectin type III domain-containing protein [Planctomycetota bacterium]